MRREELTQEFAIIDEILGGPDNDPHRTRAMEFQRAHAKDQRLMARDYSATYPPLGPCAECGDSGEKLYYGHAIPLRRGGWHTYSNTRELCTVCVLSSGKNLVSTIHVVDQFIIKVITQWLMRLPLGELTALPRVVNRWRNWRIDNGLESPALIKENDDG